MSSKRHHTEWLSLVEVSGPFLTLPVLEKVFPQGLDAHDPEHYRTLRMAFEEWEENQHKPAIHRAWIKFVLQQTLDLPDEVLVERQAIPETLKATIAEHGETLRPDFIVRNPEDVPHSGKPRLLIQVYPSDQDLEKQIIGRHWKASPATRMMELLHSTDVRLGLVTNGEHWMLVDAPRGETTGFASWYGSLWLEEKITLQAFRSLLGVHRFFSVPDDETLEAMMAESAKHQQEVTDQLGYQVRRAVEVLIQSLDRADQDNGRALLAKVPEPVIYESALTVMMRLVFLFCAEERGLLLLGDPLYDQHYAVSTLVAQLQEAADQHGEEVLERRLDAWVRLLSTFRAVYGGVEHERVKLPAYGGRLFDPDRFPFLEGREAGTKWRETPDNPLPINNRTVLHLLRSLQYLEMQGEARRLSFRALDIEQIGYVYEGLLDHTAKRATEPVLGLIGPRGDEPEIPLSKLEALKAKGEDELIKVLREEMGKTRSESALQKALDAEIETDGINRLRAACGNELFKRVSPFAGLIRNDSFDRPVVIPKGSVYVTAGTDRRSSGTHYTPRILTEPIVQYTLEPLVYIGPAEGTPKEEWKLRSPRELLDLKLCDMACGSGAFLVQACRYLSERLLEAWEDTLKTHPGVPSITPEGEPSTGKPNELLIPDDPTERLTYAMRIIAQRCLYGVDKNPLAVEMAKLSLWLLTLAKNKPFNFLDHAIRPGDSLIGIHHLDQIKYFTLDLDDKQKAFFTGAMERAVEEVIQLRKRIEAKPADNIEDAEAQKLLNDEAEAKIERLGYAAHLLLAVEFRGASASLKEDLRIGAAGEANQYLAHHTIEEFKAAASKALRGQSAYHWPLEFPEVFVERGGFDAFVCNPPFIGGQKITGNLGVSYRNFLVDHLASGKKGSADLSAYFFLRAERLLKSDGNLGMLATNTIGQGDTREVGLDQIAANGGVIYRAVPSRPWPGEANLEVAEVWLHNGEWRGQYFLDEQPVTGITPFLITPGRAIGKPHRLAANADKSFQGSIVLGMGFVLTPEEAQILIAKDKRNRDVLFPYLNGEDLNSRPDQSPSRCVINFYDSPLERVSRKEWNAADEEQRKAWEKLGRVAPDFNEPVAADYPDCLKIVFEKVKPERDQVNRKIRRERWWQFAERQPALYSTIVGLKRVIICSEVTKHLAFAFVPNKIVYSANTDVLLPPTGFNFAVLQSDLHEIWARFYSSQLETRLKYSPGNAFETFPFPEELDELEDIGERYHECRQSIMLARQEGLTRTYNRFHDPEESSADIQKLRKLHQEMDEAVARAYGWTDLQLDHDFHDTKQGVRFTISEAARREVLDRLLELNHQRYAEEEAQGLHEKGAKKKAKGGTAKKSGRSAQAPSATPSLFDDEDDEAESAPRVSLGGNDDSQRTSAPHTSRIEDDYGRPTPAGELETNDVMAAFRQTLRGRGWIGRDELLKEVSLAFGYQRLGSAIEETLRNHLRTAVRRGIVATDGRDLVGPSTGSMDDYTLEELREVFTSVMRLSRNYQREEVICAVAEYLGFSRVSVTTRQSIKSAFNSAIRQGILGYEGDIIWREG
ncbi:MAG: BREX-1 system adenine-specific DNA-methyltransferase PglX [Acidobacteria bacterium]|nr:BREX-1 system adenine-specific DNA-methyltransferase PglX [Acidobacteriota bacterium]